MNLVVAAVDMSLQLTPREDWKQEKLKISSQARRIQVIYRMEWELVRKEYVQEKVCIPWLGYFVFGSFLFCVWIIFILCLDYFYFVFGLFLFCVWIIFILCLGHFYFVVLSSIGRSNYAQAIHCMHVIYFLLIVGVINACCGSVLFRLLANLSKLKDLKKEQKPNPDVWSTEQMDYYPRNNTPFTANELNPKNTLANVRYLFKRAMQHITSKNQTLGLSAMIYETPPDSRKKGKQQATVKFFCYLLVCFDCRFAFLLFLLV